MYQPAEIKKQRNKAKDRERMRTIDLLVNGLFN